MYAAFTQEEEVSRVYDSACVKHHHHINAVSVLARACLLCCQFMSRIPLSPSLHSSFRRADFKESGTPCLPQYSGDKEEARKEELVQKRTEYEWIGKSGVRTGGPLTLTLTSKDHGTLCGAR